MVGLFHPSVSLICWSRLSMDLTPPNHFYWPILPVNRYYTTYQCNLSANWAYHSIWSRISVTLITRSDLSERLIDLSHLFALIDPNSHYDRLIVPISNSNWIYYFLALVNPLQKILATQIMRRKIWWFFEWKKCRIPLKISLPWNW